MKNHYEISGDVVLIHLKNANQITKVDLEDLPFLLSLNTTFFAHFDSKMGCYYADSRKGKLHRLILGVTGKIQVDHIYHDTLDNRRSEIRSGSCAENQRNRRSAQKNNSCGIRGVALDKQSGRWRAHVKHNGVRVLSKLFDCIEDAERAAIEVRQNIFGEWCGGVNS